MTKLSNRLREEYEEESYGWDGKFSDWREVSSKPYTYSTDGRMKKGYSRNGTPYKRSV